MTASDDSDVAFAMAACAALHVSVHVRGTDARPVVVVLDKRTRREVGGIELNRRIDEIVRARPVARKLCRPVVG